MASTTKMPIKQFKPLLVKHLNIFRGNLQLKNFHQKKFLTLSLTFKLGLPIDVVAKNFYLLFDLQMQECKRVSSIIS